MSPRAAILSTTVLLAASNVFMTYAWYGHLKNLQTRPWLYAAVVSWGIAFFEYLLQVPANRIGYGVMGLGQLKILQEAITLCVFVPFAMIYMQQKLSLDYLYAGLCMMGAVYFVFPRLMHIHILGVCGTFMGGIAALAKSAGHRVTGCDAAVYPPMSTQLGELGIDIIEGYGADQVALNPDLFVIGNVVTRGNPLMEEILNRGLPYTSGPQWLAEHVLRGRWVLAVAGTHGKTTTTAMLAWMLEHADLKPGFLIGGVAENFGLSARAGEAPFFVIEADEYDTAFFDKRSKFVHYRPRTAILNNLEYDHADIFPDLATIETQFHHLVRTVPGNGLLVVNGSDAALARVLKRGCWTPLEYFVCPDSTQGWQAAAADGGFTALLDSSAVGRAQWEILGRHNQHNALAALAAARHAGVPPALALEALASFRSVKRRLELRGSAGGISVYDDFAHHPTAIRETLAALRGKAGTARILAILDPRSNTMKQGVMKDALAPALADAQAVFCWTAGIAWDANDALAPLAHNGVPVTCRATVEELVDAVTAAARDGDQVLVMSNGGFGGFHAALLERLRAGAVTH